MNPDPNYERLREIAWRRPLTDAEQAELREWLAAHPEHQPDAEVEAALTQVLAKLPDAPMPSNFTSRVLQTIEREERTFQRVEPQSSPGWWRSLIPRLAIATVVITISGVSYRHYQNVKQAELVDAAEEFVTVAGTGPLSDPTVLEDFEVIRRMGQADEGLLALSDDLLSLKQ